MPERAFLCRFWTFVSLHQKQKTKGMEHQKTSYDTLPERIDYLIQEISEIKNILINRIEKREEIPKYLSTENALAYLKKTGFPMSKSQLYKLTSCGRMPFHKVVIHYCSFQKNLTNGVKIKFKLYHMKKMSCNY